MRANEFINEEHDIGQIYESIDVELHKMVQQHVTGPINDLSHSIAIKLKAWAMEVLHSLSKGADSEKVSMRTLRAIINDPDRFAKQLITHELNKGLADSGTTA